VKKVRAFNGWSSEGGIEGLALSAHNLNKATHTLFYHEVEALIIWGPFSD
jgi:hypothetical protein